LFEALNERDAVSRLLALAAEEDLGPDGVPGDVTTQCCIRPDQRGAARIVARADGIVSGLAAVPLTLAVFAAAARAEVQSADGQPVRAGQMIATLSGPLYQLLRAERTLLNLIGRMSGIATRTAEFVGRVRGLPVQILDTRKTSPGLRALEKYAVRCGGGRLHRSGLYDAVLFKDNHIHGVAPTDLPGWVRAAADKARGTARAQGHELRFIELEVDTPEQLEAMLRAGACGPGGVDIILLDNMDAPTLRQAVALRARHQSKVLFEASGGVTLETVRSIAETGIDRISIGGLTHHAVSLDVAMDIT